MASRWSRFLASLPSLTLFTEADDVTTAGFGIGGDTVEGTSKVLTIVEDDCVTGL